MSKPTQEDITKAEKDVKEAEERLAKLRQDFDFQEYPKYVGEVVVNSAEEEAKVKAGKTHVVTKSAQGDVVAPAPDPIDKE